MKYRLEINIRIQQYNGPMGDGSISIAEQVDVSASDFLEVAKILSHFHDLAQTLNAAKK